MFLNNLFILCYFLGGNSDVPTASSDTINTYYTINNIQIAGNKITKPGIILRELSFATYDSILKPDFSNRIKQAHENLLNTSLFNFVTIDTIFITATKINISIQVTERWYTWPIPILEIQERNFNTWWLTKDFNRTNYGFYLNRDNFRGRKEALRFKLRMGYAEQYGIAYAIPYINKKKTSGLGFAITYSRSHELAYNTIQNALLYYKDNTHYVKKEFSSAINYIHRQGIYNTHTLDVGYYKGFIADTLRFLNAEYYNTRHTTTELIAINYLFKSDYRDFKVYPLQGYYFEFGINKLGLGILKNEKINTLNFSATLKKYSNLIDRLYIAGALKTTIASNYQKAYYTQQAIGFKEYVRGYEYYVINGQNYSLLKMVLKYQLVKPTKQEFMQSKMKRFSPIHYALYTNIFSDLAYVTEKFNYRYNSLTNTLLFGTGLGIDLVTYYDTVWRIEYAINRNLEHGFFLHLNAPL